MHDFAHGPGQSCGHDHSHDDGQHDHDHEHEHSSGCSHGHLNNYVSSSDAHSNCCSNTNSKNDE